MSQDINTSYYVIKLKNGRFYRYAKCTEMKFKALTVMEFFRVVFQIVRILTSLISKFAPKC